LLGEDLLVAAFEVAGMYSLLSKIRNSLFCIKWN
jgi:hypothetical protein